LWRFFKDRVFGGYKVLLNRKVIIATLMLFVVPVLDYYGLWTITGTIIVSLSLICVGLLLTRREMGTFGPAVMSLYLLLLYGVVIYVGVRLEVIEANLYLLAESTLFLWFAFNFTMFMIQIFEFFASTGGLFLLLGSDRDRVFLSPIPQLLCCLLSVYIVVQLCGLGDIMFVYITALCLPLIAIHVVFKGKGRIVRSSIGIYALLSVYTVLISIYRQSIATNVVFWGVLFVISVLFTSQTHAKRAVTRGEREGVTYVIYAIIGFSLLSMDVFSRSLSQGWISLPYMQLLSLYALIISLPLAIIISYATGRLSYYIQRNDFTLLMLLKEAGSTLGKKILKEIKMEHIKSHLRLIL